MKSSEGCIVKWVPRYVKIVILTYHLSLLQNVRKNYCLQDNLTLLYIGKYIVGTLQIWKRDSSVGKSSASQAGDPGSNP